MSSTRPARAERRPRRSADRRQLARSLTIALGCLTAGGCAPLRAARILRDAQRPVAELAGRVGESVERVGDVEVLVFGPRADEPPRTGLVLVHGAVDGGARDPRLVALARSLAVHGFTVAAPDLASLKGFRADPRDPERIAQVARWLSGDARVDRDRVALAGISIGGSYALVAAARPELAEHVSAVLAFGAYRDLESLLTSWLVEPQRSAPELLDPLVEGRRRVFLGNVDALVAPEDREAVRRGLRALLDGESTAGEDTGSVGDAGRRLLACAASTDPIDPATAALVLAPVTDDLRRLSPGSNGRVPAARVFLLHGEDDPIVPATEARRLEAVLEDLGADVRVHVTDAFAHVDARGRPSFWSGLSLARFLAGFLKTAR